MKLYAAVARRRIGALQDNARGRELQRQAEEWMVAQNIKNPAAMTRMLAARVRRYRLSSPFFRFRTGRELFPPGSYARSSEATART